MYVRHLAVPAVACVALLALHRPAVLGRGPAPRLDRWLLLALGAIAVQLVPLPAVVLDLVSPATRPIVDVFRLSPPERALPITIDVEATALALSIAAGLVAIFVSARQIFEQGGVRTVVRVVAWCGLGLALVAIAQDATGGGLMYWTWRPIGEGPHPFGPFVNRNHFGTWALLGVPLCLGYLMAHATAHRGPRPDVPWQQRLGAALDARGGLLLAAAVLLVFATVLSLSRSSMAGLVATAAAAALLARDRLAQDPRGLRRPALLVVGAGVLSALVVVWQIDAAIIGSRFAAAGVGLADRLVIWRDTMSVVRDFWLTGSGLGSYQTAMAVYQRAMAGVIFNQAHNQYLQLAAEGGLLAGIPVTLSLAAFVREAAVRLAADRSGMYWVRAGAASGLVGVAVQSLLETGLATPANAVLTAVAAAIVVHVPARPVPGRVH